ncbi:TOBE domain-containing protein [Sulfurimonas sp.]|uniref:TOBE domain-containing protein n=1 Tax=Sulfurimonas sp. TaxID=2022749 RepID=UPI003D11DBD0
MKISARNQLQGVVHFLDEGTIDTSVYVRLQSGYTLVSIITNEAVADLKLEMGDDVIVFFKSSSVLIMTDISLGISARNKFQGNIKKIKHAEVTAQIVVDIGNNEKIVSTITQDAVELLELQTDKNVSAIIKATDVMIAK